MARVRTSSSVRTTSKGRDLEQLIARLRGAAIWVGIRSAKDPDGEIVQRAVSNEFGELSRRIPERSFMRSTFDAKIRVYSRRIGQALRKASPSETIQELDLVGVLGAGDVVRTIDAGVLPPNAPSTIAAKGSSATLRGKTGQMRQSIGSQLIVGEGPPERLP